MDTRAAIRAGLEKATIMLVERQQWEANRPRHALMVDEAGKPMFHTVRDKLGDIIRVYRASPIPLRLRSKYTGEQLRAIREKNGVGRPPSPYGKSPAMAALPAMRAVNALPMKERAAASAAFVRDRLAEQIASVDYSSALQQHGSQRAAARALGLNLSTFQRRLAKEQA
jgi:hypothetical protein